MGYYDFEKKITVIDTQLKYPIKKPIKAFNFSDQIFKVNFTINNATNEMFINFPFSPYVYVFDFVSKTYKLYNLNSQLIDTTDVYNNNYTGKKLVYSFGKVYFDETTQKYYRFTMIKINENVYHTLVTYDENFNYIGEKFLPHGLEIINNKAYYYYLGNNSLIIEENVPIEIDYDEQKFKKELDKINEQKKKLI